MDDDTISKRLVDTYNKDVSEYIDQGDEEIFHYTSPTGLNGIISS